MGLSYIFNDNGVPDEVILEYEKNKDTHLLNKVEASILDKMQVKSDIFISFPKWGHF